jgi:hypothetical protein
VPPLEDTQENELEKIMGAAAEELVRD